MNLRDLKYLVALVDHRHFGKAAEKCFVSQPALSMQIKKLEKYLGVQLLERNNKTVLLTEIGAALAERARHILNQADEMRELAKSAKDPYSGELKLGIIPTLAPYLLPHIIPLFSNTFPKLSIYLIEKQTTQLIEKLQHGKVHAIILASSLTGSGLEQINLFEEEFLLAMPSHHALAQRKTIKQKDVLNHNLFLLEEGHCMREQSLALCNTLRMTETQNFRGTSLETLRHMVMNGVGMTLMPKLACKADKNIAYVAFSAPKPTRTITLYWRTSIAKQLLLNEMGMLIKNNFSPDAVS